MSLNILIIEDDPSFVLEIEMILHELGDYTILTSDNLADARVQLEKEIDLVLLDMRLGDQVLGLDLLELISEKKVPFIVSTAFNDKDFYEATKKYNPEAYLVKPFDKLTLLGIIEKILPSKDFENFKYSNDGLFVKENKEFQKLIFQDIRYIKAEGNYCTIFLKDKRLTVRNSIKSFVEKMPTRYFIRVHRSYIINVSHIHSIEFAQNIVRLGDEAIPIGRNYKKGLKTKMLSDF